MHSVVQTGLNFTKDNYDRERYILLRDMANQIISSHSDMKFPQAQELFSREQGYITPKAAVRAAIFNPEGKILMVKQRDDGG